MGSPIRTYDVDQLKEIMTSLGQPSFRATQLFEWLHAHHAISYDEMTNLPASLRVILDEAYPIRSLQTVDKQVSTDGTRKYVLGADDGARIETVGIPSFNSQNEISRLTVCLSSQAGCPMGCLFCATGKEGFTRNLSTQEMTDQIISVQRDFSHHVSNVVVMGQGEPFLNYNEVVSALRIMNDPSEFDIGARRIVVSSCGIKEGIRSFASEPEQFTLAISLHSAIQRKRNSLMPRMASSPLDRLKKELTGYVSKTGRRVTLEHLLIKDLNDQDEDISALLGFCQGLRCHVNLLAINKIDGIGLSPPGENVLRKWESTLRSNGVNATIRHSHGADINGACGQLKNALA